MHTKNTSWAQVYIIGWRVCGYNTGWGVMCVTVGVKGGCNAPRPAIRVVWLDGQILPEIYFWPANLLVGDGDCFEVVATSRALKRCVLSSNECTASYPLPNLHKTSESIHSLHQKLFMNASWWSICLQHALSMNKFGIHTACVSALECE